MWCGALVAVAALAGVAAAPSERPAPADVVLTLAGPSAAELHGTARFVIAVHSESFGPPVDARVTVRLPAGMRYVGPADATIPCSGTRVTVVCAVGRLPASFAFPVEAALPGRATIEAVAETDALDSRPEDNVDSATVVVYGLALRRLRTTPARPRAGRRFVSSATLVRTDTGAAVRSRSAACLGGIARRPAGSVTPLRPSVTGGTRISCAWSIPARARGRIFRGVVFDRRSSGYQPKLSFSRRVAG